MDIFLNRHCHNMLKLFKFPVIIPFHGPAQEDPIELRIRTISQNVNNIVTPPATPALKEHFSLNTGFITIILMTGGAAAVYILASKSSSYQERYAIVCPVLLFISILIPVYWTWANDDLRRFTMRIIRKMLMC